MEKKREEEQTTTEAQEETKSNVLASLLAKVDMSDPLEIPMDSGQILTITQEQFISYYLPVDATRAEKAKCFNETRAAGLNPAIRGDCHYFKTGGGPLALFVGYHVYIRKAYANGLNHIHKPELVYDEETGELDSCVVTLDIEGRPEFTWETWLSEVVAERNGQPNTRWVKAKRQMLIKCSVTNTLRMAGIATLGILPPTMDEMPDFSAPGHRTLTQDQLDAHGLPEQGEATPGVVTAADHQIDMSPFRKSYFKALAERGIFQDDDERKEWQLEAVGKASTTEWTVEDYSQMMDIIHEIPKTDPDPPSTGGVQKPTEKTTGEIVGEDWAGSADKAMDAAMGVTGGDKFLEGLPDVPEEHLDSPKEKVKEEFLRLLEKIFDRPDHRSNWCRINLFPIEGIDKWAMSAFETGVKMLIEFAAEKPTDDTGGGNTQEDAKDGQEQGEADAEQAKMSKATRRILIDLVNDFPEGVYQTVRSQAFKKRAQEVIDRWIQNVGDLSEDEAKALIASLEDEKASINGTGPRVTSEKVGEEAQDKEYAEQEEETSWLASAECARAREAYMARVQGGFDSVAEMIEFQELNTGIGNFGLWHQEHFDKANAALDALEAKKQFEELKTLFTELMPDKTYAAGSKEARDFISTVTKKPFHGIRLLTTEQIGDVILALKDKLSDAKTAV